VKEKEHAGVCCGLSLGLLHQQSITRKRPAEQPQGQADRWLFELTAHVATPSCCHLPFLAVDKLHPGLAPVHCHQCHHQLENNIGELVEEPNGAGTVLH